MNSNEQPDGFERRASELLRAGADGMDAQMRARLARARAAALESPPHARGWLEFRYLAPAGVMAAAVLATVLLVGPGREAGGVNDATGTALYDLDLLADADAFDIAQESDLEFIEWAAAQGEQDGAGG
jgi:poly(3-hydroxybutyrate) depolymerase